jgi:lysophospholipase L1-like esterase
MQSLGTIFPVFGRFALYTRGGLADVNTTVSIARRLFRAAMFFGICALMSGFATAQSRVASGEHWVGTWAASPQMPPPAGDQQAAADAGFNNQTVRMIVRVSIGGEELHVRFSNAYSATALTIGDAHVALAGSGAAIVPGTDRKLTFSGQASFTIPAGATVLSDPVQLKVPMLGELAISVFLPAPTGPATWHMLARETTYISGTGDLCASADMQDAKTENSWYWLSSVEVLASERTSAIVALGDSITDGAYATLNGNNRWPDVLADQVSKGGGSGAPLAVLNEGISGNRLLHDVAGMNALARFDSDVLAQDGVRYLIVLDGINDIGWPDMEGGKYAGDAVTAQQMIAALQQIAERAHAHGIRVFGATLTPFEGAFYQTPDGEAEREAVNHWIRTSGAFDEVIDFDKLTRDPAHPNRFLPTYDSGDHLHPGPAGYEAMGKAAAKLFRSSHSSTKNH